jgi:hypothetical protein
MLDTASIILPTLNYILTMEKIFVVPDGNEVCGMYYDYATR